MANTDSEKAASIPAPEEPLTISAQPRNATAASNSTATVSANPRRFAQVIRLPKGNVEEYVKLHSAVWPGVLAQISRSNIHDYSIFYEEGLGLLFATFKYTGHDFKGDMEKMKQDEETRKWWKVTDGLQESLVDGATGSDGENGWWKEMREVFYTE